MSIMDELKKLTRPYDDDSLMDGDDDLDMDLDQPAYSRPVASDPVQAPQDHAVNVMGASSGMGGGYSEMPPRPAMNTMSMGGAPEASKYRVVLVKPEEFDAATAIARHICQGDTVILNCEDTNEQVARRVIDFLSGCAFALDGSIKKASRDVIIIAPRDVGVDDAKVGDQDNA